MFLVTCANKIKPFALTLQRPRRSKNNLNRAGISEEQGNDFLTMLNDLKIININKKKKKNFRYRVIN